MKADMSSEAIGQRLRIMGELWELSIALMNSKEIGETSNEALVVNTRKDLREAETGSAVAGGAKSKTLTLLIVTVIICAITGGLCASSVVAEPIAYIASISHGIMVLYVVTPVVLILFCLGIAAASLQSARYAVVFFTSVVVLPASYLGIVLGAQGLGIAQYQTSGLNEMRPIGSEPQHRIVVVFKKGATPDEIHQFDENILRKSVSKPYGVLLEFADGICNFSYPQLSDVNNEFSDVDIVDIPFCPDATEEKKQRVRSQIISSPIVYAAFEDVAPGEVKRLK